jgi:hypothetical protein
MHAVLIVGEKSGASSEVRLDAGLHKRVKYFGYAIPLENIRYTERFFDA